MGFLDKFKIKDRNHDAQSPAREQDKSQSMSKTAGRRIKKYTSDGKPVY